MAKKVVNILKLQIPAGGANPSPPVGPALPGDGPAGYDRSPPAWPDPSTASPAGDARGRCPHAPVRRRTASWPGWPDAGPASHRSHSVGPSTAAAAVPPAGR